MASMKVDLDEIDVIGIYPMDFDDINIESSLEYARDRDDWLYFNFKSVYAERGVPVDLTPEQEMYLRLTYL
jgi:hypothetical protein